MKSYAKRQFNEMKETTIKVGMLGALIYILIVLLLCFSFDESQESTKKPRISIFQNRIMENKKVNQLKP